MAGAETTGEVMCKPAVTPPSARASASPSLAQQAPIAPAAIWRRAISGLLWVLAWGRSFSPLAAAKAAIRSMLRVSASRSTTRAGVLRSRREPWRSIRWPCSSWSFMARVPVRR